MAKAPKTVVNYREGSGQEQCGNCEHFIQPDSCEVVEGIIASTGMSDLFEPIDIQGASSSVEDMMLPPQVPAAGGPI